MLVALVNEHISFFLIRTYGDRVSLAIAMDLFGREKGKMNKWMAVLQGKNEWMRGIGMACR